jgi:CRP/FNR family transcriptional regulator, cyclic AMP receptor protein
MPKTGETSPESVGINKVWYLKRINIFEGMDEESVRQLEPYLQHRRYDPREMIFLPGDQGDKVYFLKEGLVKLARLSPGGKEMTLALLERGEIFGEMSFLDGLPRETFAQAMERVLVCIARAQDFQRFVDRKPGLGLKISMSMGERVRDLEQQIENLVFRDVPGRLASMILRLAKKHGTAEHPQGDMIDLRLTHQEIANLIGATRESASINISRLRSEGLIEVDRHRFVIRNRGGLEEMLDAF